MRALLCHYCRHRLEAEDDEALLGLVRDHLIQEHPAIVPIDEQVGEIVSTRAYRLEYARRTWVAPDAGSRAQWAQSKPGFTRIIIRR